MRAFIHNRLVGIRGEEIRIFRLAWHLFDNRFECLRAGLVVFDFGGAEHVDSDAFTVVRKLAEDGFVLVKEWIHDVDFKALAAIFIKNEEHFKDKRLYRGARDIKK